MSNNNVIYVAIPKTWFYINLFYLLPDIFLKFMHCTRLFKLYPDICYFLLSLFQCPGLEDLYRYDLTLNKIVD